MDWRFYVIHRSTKALGIPEIPPLERDHVLTHPRAH